ncbi:hypothetical protein EDEG_02890 [Edhazardia aedis USNM 41457]|uniref:Uncharacterized protein n=1 Tax=Edhazardia aedis (strain USNM 41457) TaxID=1003232 RepID=J9D4H4_EDHAE|nr:hypothetical protein EDEG_02890 [Edhazardia aedis USNM 41457]|eukprot:EJW02706.1 hypothetical protein EDEG_02890 [Edhazardia aedis USNM 41457]
MLKQLFFVFLIVNGEPKLKTQKYLNMFLKKGINFDSVIREFFEKMNQVYNSHEFVEFNRQINNLYEKKYLYEKEDEKSSSIEKTSIGFIDKTYTERTFKSILQQQRRIFNDFQDVLKTKIRHLLSKKNYPVIVTNIVIFRNLGYFEAGRLNLLNTIFKDFLIMMDSNLLCGENSYNRSYSKNQKKKNNLTQNFETRSIITKCKSKNIIEDFIEKLKISQKFFTSEVNFRSLLSIYTDYMNNYIFNCPYSVDELIILIFEFDRQLCNICKKINQLEMQINITEKETEIFQNRNMLVHTLQFLISKFFNTFIYQYELSNVTTKDNFDDENHVLIDLSNRLIDFELPICVNNGKYSHEYEKYRNFFRHPFRSYDFSISSDSEKSAFDDNCDYDNIDFTDQKYIELEKIMQYCFTDDEIDINENSEKFANSGVKAIYHSKSNQNIDHKIDDETIKNSSKNLENIYVDSLEDFFNGIKPVTINDNTIAIQDKNEESNKPSDLSDSFSKQTNDLKKNVDDVSICNSCHQSCDQNFIPSALIDKIADLNAKIPKKDSLDQIESNSCIELESEKKLKR